MKEGLVINLHICEECNFHCKHCFAHFGTTGCLEVDYWKSIIDNIIRDIPVKRFNLAGGEPLLFQGLESIIDYIHRLGIEVSIISNGYLLNEGLIDKWTNKVSMIGISIDALSHENIINLGRCTLDEKSLGEAEYLKLCNDVQSRGIKLKVNTVVNRINMNENFFNFISSLNPIDGNY